MKTLHVTERAHTPISPSNIGRVMRCTASHRDATAGRRAGALRVAGEAATEGTAAHALLEHALRHDVKLEAIEAVRVNGTQVPVTDRMRGAVQTAVDWVRRELAGRDLLLEAQVQLPWGRIAGWVDIAAGPPPCWTVIDFKYGYATVPADSPQLGVYLLSLLLEHERSIEGDGEAVATIIQPRAPAEPVRTHTWAYADLRALRDPLLETLDRIRRGDWSYSVGHWCRWCPVAATCPELAAVARDAVATELAAPQLIASGEFGAAQLDAALLLADPLEHRIRQTWKLAEEYLTSGGKLEHFKLVAKPRNAGTTVVPRSDPRPEIHVGATLKAALRGSLAFEFLNAARTAQQQEKAQ